MRIEYIGHATLLIDTGDVKILTDPWFNGPAYCGQWHIFPKPVNVEVANSADFILLSHGHEDHLHHETLLSLDKTVKVFYPYQWQKGIKDYFHEIGFKNVTEAITYKTYKISATTSITYMANSLDSIIIIESNGEVLVNVNDALHAHPAKIIDLFVAKIRNKWKTIDYVFCGYGGASYFPNTVHFEGKNDLEMGMTREQLFAHNFCRIVSGLNPKAVVPFAADYVLLNPEKRWINEVKFSKSVLNDYYKNHYEAEKDVEFLVMYSGDIVENFKLIPNSPYRKVDGKKNDLIDQQYADEIADFKKIRFISEDEIASMSEMLSKNILARSKLFSVENLNRINYVVVFEDIKKDSHFNIKFLDGKPSLTRLNDVPEGAILTINTNSKIINYSLASEWGGDAIIIGYGAEIHILDKTIIDDSLDIICVRLLTRQPVATSQMKKHPFRAITYLSTNPLTTSWAIKQMISSRDNVNKIPMNERSNWLERTKCEVCQICDMPLLTDEFASKLN